MVYKTLAYKKVLAVLQKVSFNVNPGHLKSPIYMIEPSGKIYWPSNRFNLKLPDKSVLKSATESCLNWAIKHNLYQQTFLRSIIESTLPTVELRKPEFAKQKQAAIESLISYIKTVFDSHADEFAEEGQVKPFVDKLRDIFSTGEQTDTFANFEYALIDSSMLNADEIESSLQSLETRPTEESFKRALSIENPYTGKSTNIQKVLDLFYLYDKQAKDPDDKQAKDPEILTCIKEIYELEDLATAYTLETPKDSSPESIAKFLHEQDITANIINLIKDKKITDITDITLVAEEIKSKIDKLITESETQLDKLSKLEMFIYDYPEIALAHVNRINSVFLDLNDDENLSTDYTILFEKIKSNFTQKLAQQLLDNLKNASKFMSEKIDTSIKFSYITTFSLNKDAMGSFSQKQTLGSWLENLEVFMQDCTQPVDQDILILNAKAMMWIFEVDDWVEEQTDLFLVRRALKQLFNIMSAQIEGESFAHLIAEYELPTTFSLSEDLDVDSYISDEFNAFKSTLSNICSDVKSEFSKINGTDHSDFVSYGDFMKEVHRYLTSVLHECTYNHANITLSKHDFYKQRMDTSGCKVFSIMSILAGKQKVSKEVFQKSKRVEYHMNMLTSITNGVIFSSIKEHASYNWKHNDIYIEFVNDLRDRLKNALKASPQNVTEYNDSFECPSNIIAETLRTINSTLENLPRERYKFNQSTMKVSFEDLLNQSLNNPKIQKKGLKNAVKTLYQDLNSCITDLFNILKEPYVVDENIPHITEMICLAAIWQWVDGGWIAQALTPRYKTSSQQFMLKSDLSNFLKQHNLFDYLASDNSYDKENECFALKHNKAVSTARANLCNMISNLACSYEPTTLSLLINLITKQFSEIANYLYACNEAREIADSQLILSKKNKLARLLNINLEFSESKFSTFAEPTLMFIKQSTQIVNFLNTEFFVGFEKLEDLEFVYCVDDIKIRVSGTWELGQLSKGKYSQFDNGEYEVYEGQFENGRFHGIGKLIHDDLGQDYIQEGEFENGKFLGVTEHWND